MNIKDFYDNQKNSKPSKYKAKATVVDGIRFDSGREAKYYIYLKALEKNGEVHHFLRQTPFHLPGGVRYYLDFMVFFKGKWYEKIYFVDWWDIKYIDVKGVDTDVSKLKRKQVEEIYKIKIELL